LRGTIGYISNPVYSFFVPLPKGRHEIKFPRLAFLNLQSVFLLFHNMALCLNPVPPVVARSLYFVLFTRLSFNKKIYEFQQGPPKTRKFNQKSGFSPWQWGKPSPLASLFQPKVKKRAWTVAGRGREILALLKGQGRSKKKL